MFASQTVLGYLDRVQADFDLLTHPHVRTALAAARTAHVPAEQLAKAVLLRDDDELLLAVVPSSSRVNTWAVSELTDSGFMQVLGEDEIRYVFRDCELGAIPALGAPFGVRSVIDDGLLYSPDVYFEAGDHEHLIHMRGAHFSRIVSDQLHGTIAYRKSRDAEAAHRG